MSARTNVNQLVSTVPTTQQVEHLFADLIRVGDLHVYLAGLLAVDCGLDPGQIIRLRWTDCDFDKGITTLSHEREPRPRIVHMTDRVCHELRGRCPVAGTDEYVFLPHHGRPAVARSLQASLRKAGRRLGVQIGLRLLRRKFATDLVNRGVSMCDLSKVLGFTPWAHADSMLAYLQSK